MRVRILKQGVLHRDMPNIVGMTFELLTLSPIKSAYIQLPPGYTTREGHPITRQFVEFGDYELVDEEGAPAAPTPGYADGNPKSLQGAKKFSLRYLPLSANIEVNRALEDGAAKYGAANWREKGVATSVYIDACKRHLELYFDCSQQNATDSNVHNLGHAMACLAIIIDAEKAGSLIDDRPFPFPDGDALLLRPVK